MHPAVLRFLLLPGALLAAACAARAAVPARPVVPGFERFGTGDKAGLARGGRLLAGELGCAACHLPGDTAPAPRRQAPVLSDVGGRVRAGYLKKFLADPQAAKPGTLMPNLLLGDPERDRKVQAL